MFCFAESLADAFTVQTPMSEVDTDRKQESADKGHVSAAKSEMTEESAFESPDKGEETEDEKMLKKYPGEIPIIDTIKKPTQGEVRGRPPSSTTSLRPSPAKDKGRPVTGKRDMSNVLSYMKKNKYDDTGMLVYILSVCIFVEVFGSVMC